MIFVTEEARRYVRTVSTNVGLPEGAIFRLDETGTGRYLRRYRLLSRGALVFRLDETGTGWHGEPPLAMSIDEPRDGDEPIEHEGEYLLHVSETVSAAYDGFVLDLEETPRGAVFTVVGLPKAEPNVRYDAPCTPGFPG